MSKRSRLVAWLAAAALVAGAVIVLRVPENTVEKSDTPAVVVDRFAADLAVLPGPGNPPAQPARIVVVPDSGRLRLYWADGLAGGEPLPDVIGYEVRWERLDGGEEPGMRLVIAPDVQLNGLTDGERYRVQVRGVDAYGRRSAPTEATGEPGRAARPWPAGLTGLYDDFTDPATVDPESPKSRWHVSGYGACLGLDGDQAESTGLEIGLGCGAEMAVLRARTPLRLQEQAPDTGELGRVAVLTDAAGPGGELTVDLVPGRPDQAGVSVRRASRAEESDPGLPGGTIRVAVSDGGVRVSAAPDVRAGEPTVEVQQAPRRGPGVLHLFEVVLTPAGVRVYQDGLAVASRSVVPAWREASVLIGFRGPRDRRSRVHLAAAGFSGPASPAAGVVEAPVNPTTKRILAPAEPEPRIGEPRAPLVAARAARLVATLAANRELDPDRVVVQMGGLRVPARPAVAVPPSADGAALTVIADVPPSLLGPRGPDMIAPFVLRAPDADTTATVLESYLEITPTEAWRGRLPASRRFAEPPMDAMPVVEVELGNAAGDPLTSRTLPRQGQLVLTVRLDAVAAQWDTGAVAGVQGVQVWLNGTLVAGIPTDEDGPGVGGTYAVSLALGGLTPGNQLLEVGAYGMDGVRPPESTAVANFTVVR